MNTYVSGMLAGLAGLAAGLWLLVAPFALGYQPQDADWVTATKVDVFTGLAVAVVGLVVVAAFAAGARAHLVRLGVVRGRRTAAPEEPAGRHGDEKATDDLHALLAPLVAAMTRDQRALDAGGDRLVDVHEGGHR